MDQSQTRTAIQIAKTLAAELLGVWDGKQCVEYLQKHNYQWKQMEWIGWYFEHRAKQILDAKTIGMIADWLRGEWYEAPKPAAK